MPNKWKITQVTHSNGCVTKFNKNGRYTGAPGDAAKKAFSQLLRRKKLSGKVVLNITMEAVPKRENKVHTYRLTRKLKKKPVVRVLKLKGQPDKEIVFKYDYEVVPAKKKKPSKGKSCSQTTGPMKKNKKKK
jgi:hypothetical protein